MADSLTIVLNRQISESVKVLFYENNDSRELDHEVIDARSGTIVISFPTGLETNNYIYRIFNSRSNQIVREGIYTVVNNGGVSPSGGVELGETSTTAHRGDHGATAYSHSQSLHAPTSAEQNVNADWNSVSGDSQILNKPSILALGNLITNAYYGDKGKAAYDHSQVAHAPSGAQINNISDVNATDLTDGGSTTLHKHSYSNLDNQPTVPNELADLTDDATHRVVTDTEKSTWNAKSELALGELSSNAYRGDYGATAYSHSQSSHAPATAEQNVNADWSSISGDSQILNKPTIPAALADLTEDATHRVVTDTEKSTWNGKSDLVLGDLITNAYYGDKGKTAYDHSQVAHAPAAAEQNVNADWNSATGDSQILNKPTIPSALADLSDDSTHRIVTDVEKSAWNGKSELVLGELSTNAYRGDYGATAYSHSQSAHAPSNAQANNISDVNATDLTDGGETALHSHASSGGLSQAQVLTRML